MGKPQVYMQRSGRIDQQQDAECDDDKQYMIEK
jgi:hypothetical protein